MGHFPYGESWYNASNDKLIFTTYERDTETGNDDFGARYYSSRFGRWLSADWSSVPVPVPYANLTNPQTLNLYAMVADDPESFAELDGHCGQLVMPGAPTATQSCGNNYSAGLEGEGAVPFDENTGIPDWYLGEVSAATAQYIAQQQAQQNAKEHDQKAQKNKKKQKSKTKQQLSYNTVSGGQGSATWFVQWKLSEKSQKGGWIVQQITLTDSTGKQVMTYWEAWQVEAGKQSTIYQDMGIQQDDIFSTGIFPHWTVSASARFYEGLGLPDTFIKDNRNTTAGDLRSTTIDPRLSTNGATDPVDRTWTSPW